MLKRIDTVLGGELLLGGNLESGGLEVGKIDVMALQFEVVFAMPLDGKLLSDKVTFGGFLVGDAP